MKFDTSTYTVIKPPKENPDCELCGDTGMICTSCGVGYYYEKECLCKLNKLKLFGRVKL